MKIRVTLTMDPEVSHRAKQTARRHGTSVSGLVEQLLRQSAGEAMSRKVAQPFSKRWGGKLEPTTWKDPRSVKLRAKYGMV